MRAEHRELLRAWDAGRITRDETLARFPRVLLDDAAFIENDIEAAIAAGMPDGLNEAVLLLGLSEPAPYIALKNRLLVTPGHRFHQMLAKDLQDLADPSTVPFVRRALEMGFDHLAYTASEDGVIAKWYSWLLADIGTREALDLIAEYADSSNEEVAAEMRYRLERL
jgi:hypothetical protein